MDDIDRTVRTDPYKGPAGGCGSARSRGNILRREGVLLSGALCPDFANMETRMVVVMSTGDMTNLDLRDGETVGPRTLPDDGVNREMTGFRVTTYNIPAGNIGTYYPETNAL